MSGLAGRRIVVTRPRERAASLVRAIQQLGGEALVHPLLRIERLPGPPPPGPFDWIALTSAAAVRSDLPPGRLAVVGPATGQAVEALGRAVALQAGPDAAALAEAMGQVAGQRILFPCSDRAREVLPRRLRERGAEVVVWVAYRTVLQPDPALAAALQTADALTLASPSAVAGVRAQWPGPLPPGLVVAACGESTAQAARDAWGRVDLVVPGGQPQRLAEGLASLFERVP